MSRFQELVEVARASMEELSVPGLALGVLFGGQEETAGLGVTSIENPLEVTPDTRFQIGSITKTFTATAIMRLVEAGRLSLDDPVRTYLPELRLSDEDVAARATIRHLLTHTGGWEGDYFDDLGWGDDALGSMVKRLRGLPQLTPLGEVYAYNNAGFYIAGRVLEVMTEQTFEQALHELILEPLALESTCFFPDDVVTRRFAVGHDQDESDETIVARPWAVGRAAHPAGGLLSTVPDLLRYARLWMGGGDLLAPTSLEEMLRPQISPGDEFDSVGLAWFMRTRNRVPVIAHGGGTKGQVSWLAIAHKHDFACVVLTNHIRGGTAAERIFDQATETYLGFREPELEAIELPAERVSEYVGRYESKMVNVELAPSGAGLELRLTFKGGFPTPETPPPPSPPPLPVAFSGENAIFVPEGLYKGLRAEFLRDAAGRIEWFRMGRVYSPVDS
jgi:CubicO group peptidase (beta-lactamase class C family)